MVEGVASDGGLCGVFQVLYFDSSNVESIACLASHHFYTDQPEIALRFYRRLLQVRPLDFSGGSHVNTRPPQR